MTPQTANHINKQEDFAHKFLENALEIAQQQLAGMTLHGDEDGMATVEVAVPLRVRVHIEGDGEGLMRSGPPGTLCCTCTRDKYGDVHCWGSSSQPCC